MAERRTGRTQDTLAEYVYVQFILMPLVGVSPTINLNFGSHDFYGWCIYAA